MSKEKLEPRDAIDAMDALTMNLNQAKGIVYAVSQATMKAHREFHYALESAFEHLEGAKEAVDDLCEAREVEAKAKGG